MDNEKERQIVILNLDDILPNRFQPRIKFNDQAINELAESIKLYGVIQPIVVRKISDKYEIIAGERRYKASILAGKTTIPAIVTTLDDRNGAEIALIENIQRQDLTPIEEAISYKKILDMGYISQGELGEKLGKNQSTIANKLRLLNLNDEVQEALMENKISERHARSLLKLDDKKQILMLNRIINERLTVRKTDEEIDKLLHNVEEEKIEPKEEKEENIMNNDILKEFNIPSSPIIDDSANDSILFDMEEKKEEPVATTSNIEEPINQSNNINPGFMDLNKIQTEAQDIIKEPEPIADMNELLKSSENLKPVIEEPVEQPKEEQKEEEPVRTGKFFNFFNFNTPAKEENNNFVENVEDKQVNMDFGEPTHSDVNIFTSPINETPVETIADSTPSNEDSNEDSTVEIKPITPIQEESEVPLYEPPVVEPVQDTSVENPIDSENNNQNNFPQFEDTAQPFALTDDQDFTKPLNSFNADGMSSIGDNVVEPVKKSYMMNDDVTFDDDGEIEVKVDKNNEKFVTADMKTVINTIRECAATIEKFGYKIDTDEIDLPNAYEVTFHIEKNN
jgi:ParB family chromosome partitioning protein